MDGEVQTLESMDDRVVSLISEWGWKKPNERIIKDASLCLKVRGKSMPEVIRASGLLKSARIDEIVKKYGERSRSIAVFTTEEPDLIGETQRLQCLQEGIQYFPELGGSAGELMAHGSMNEPIICDECERYSCMLMTLQGETPVLVFGDLENALRRYQQMAGAERRNCALRNRFGEDAVVAVGRRNEVLASLASFAEQNTGTQGMTGGVRVISENSLQADHAFRKLASIHRLAADNEATDIHIDPGPGGAPILQNRVYGDLLPIAEKMTAEQYTEVTRYLLRASGAMIKPERVKKPLDGNYQYSLRDGRLFNIRCSFIPLSHDTGSSGSDAISIRLRLMAMESGRVDLTKKKVAPRLIEVLKKAVRPSQGLIMLVGPTGSGKSTTIAGILNLHEQIYGMRRSRLSIEDPIERLVPGVTQIQVPYEMRGTDEGFGLIFRNVMRHDPDMIWMGEIRDQQTATSAVQYAATGHLVVSTLHAESAMSGVERLVNMLPPEKPEMRSAAIRSITAMVSQRLVKRLCRDCREARKPSEDELDYIEYLKRQRGIESLENPSQVYDATGCDKCDGTGVVGVLPANEILLLSPAARDYFIDGVGTRMEIEKSIDVRMEQAVMQLIESGDTGFESLGF